MSAAGLKAYDLLFGAPSPETGSWVSRSFWIGAIEVECLLGLWLLSGLSLRRARWAAVPVFLTLFAISLSKALAGEENCGCFGRVPIDPRWTAGLDLGAILALGTWRPANDAGRPGRARGFSVALVLFLFFVLGASVVFVLAVGQEGFFAGDAEIDAKQSVVLLEPEKWVGRRCPLLPYTDIGEDLSRGRWIVVLYRHDCRQCEAAAPGEEDCNDSGASDCDVASALVRVRGDRAVGGPPRDGDPRGQDLPGHEY